MVNAVKHVPIGMQFTGVCHSGRVITLGKVVEHQSFDSAYPHKVRWYDENGKHYGRFNLHNPDEEFKEFNIIHPKEKV